MVNKLEDAARWRAPEPLEDLRRFLNTWEYLARTGEERDHLPELGRDASKWRGRFSSVRPPRRSELRDLASVRDRLRQAVERGLDDEWLNERLRAAGMTAAVASGPRGKARIHFVPHAGPTAISDVLAIVIEAIRDDSWARLKACPDCRLVFFDQTRNASKRWCQMSAKGGGRACGSIAKVRSWRSRKAGDTG